MIKCIRARIGKGSVRDIEQAIERHTALIAWQTRASYTTDERMVTTCLK